MFTTWVGPVAFHIHAQSLDPNLVSQIRQDWAPVLGSDGPGMADRLIKEYTPACLQPSSDAKLEEEAKLLRYSLIQEIGLDLERPVLSSEMQKSIDADGYRIDVVRLEVFPGVFLPVNIYHPEDLVQEQVPLVVSIPGCGSGTHSDYIQIMGGNLAKRGMVTLTPEGFCRNGARADYDKNEYIGYGNVLFGQPSKTEIFLQELVSAITWASEFYPHVDVERVGAVGYSYGGQMASMLGALDTRIRSVSAPATYLGDQCGDFRLNSDIKVERANPNHVWSASLRIPVVPVSWRLPLTYPRSLHTTSGYADWGAHPDFMDKVMAYAVDLYSIGQYQNQVLYRTDALPHGYFVNRREDSYEWFMHTLFGEPLHRQSEVPIQQLSQTELQVDIAGTETTQEILLRAINDRAEIRQSVLARTEPNSSRRQMAERLANLSPSLTVQQISDMPVWHLDVGPVRIRTFQFDATSYSFPVYIFENTTKMNRSQVLYLPELGTLSELDEIFILLDKYHTVISLDYLGMGELRSDRIMQHSFSRYFMTNNPSLPQLNVELIFGYMQHAQGEAIDIYAQGWTSSLYALILKWLAPEEVDTVYPHGIPDDEFAYIGEGRRVPDLLLWRDLFLHTSSRELSEPLQPEVELLVNDGAVDSLQTSVMVSLAVTSTDVAVAYLELSQDREHWHSFGFDDAQDGVEWDLSATEGVATIYGRTIDVLGNVSRHYSDTIHIVDSEEPATGLTINNGSPFANSHEITLTLVGPDHPARVAIRDTAQACGAVEAEAAPAWQPYQYSQNWTLQNLGPNCPLRRVYVQFQDVKGRVSQTYFSEVILDEEAPVVKRIQLLEPKDNGVAIQFDVTDSLSGVNAMMINSMWQKADEEWLPYSDSIHWDVASGYEGVVRFRDRAGNLTEGHLIQVPRTVYLPVISSTAPEG